MSLVVESISYQLISSTPNPGTTIDHLNHLAQPSPKPSRAIKILIGAIEGPFPSDASTAVSPAKRDREEDYTSQSVAPQSDSKRQKERQPSPAEQRQHWKVDVEALVSASIGPQPQHHHDPHRRLLVVSTEMLDVNPHTETVPTLAPNLPPDPYNYPMSYARAVQLPPHDMDSLAGPSTRPLVNVSGELMQFRALDAGSP